MNKKELLQYVKEKCKKSSIKFPRGIDFQENNNIITITMLDSVAKNMQDDSAAFEGWALCLKAVWATESMKCCLKWKKYSDPKDPHYQRFLYRVDRFKNIFGGWFLVDDESEEFLCDLRTKDYKKYLLNSPSTNKKNRINYETKNIESRLENEILIQQDHLKELQKYCPATLYRQLPVGLFHDEVKENNAIFPSKHSAIDLWGTEGNDLYILELKAKRNCKVGALSELFFYTMMLRDEQAGIFIRKLDKKEPIEEKSVKNTNQIKAFILAPELHPFITQKVFNILNEKLINQKMEFGYINFDYEPEPKLRFNSFNRVY